MTDLRSPVLPLWPFAALSLAACGGHHAATDPTTTPIEAVEVDAAYVVNGGDASITVIDAAGNEVLGTIQIADAAYPHHLAISGDGQSLYVAIPGVDLSQGHGEGGGHGDHMPSYVLKLSAATGDVEALASLAASNHNAAPAPDGTTVWTAQTTESGSVLVLDASTLEQVDEVSVGAMPAEVTFAPDGSVGFVANGGSNSVSALDPATHQVLATIEVGETPVGAWPGSDGLMYVDNEAGQSISAIDPATLEVGRTYPLGFTPAYAAILSDELWVTDTDAGRLVFFEREGGAMTGELPTGAGAHAIAINAAGTRAWVTNQAADTVSVIDVASRTVVAEVPTGFAPNGIALRELP